MARIRVGATGLAVVALVLSACSGTGGGNEEAPERRSATSASTSTMLGPEVDLHPVVELRPLSVSDDGVIVDDQNLQVLLRGVNITSLGEYWQGDPEHPPTQPMRDDDWDAMQALGFNVVRLVVTWSLLEPERGVIDDTYLDQIDGYVRAAAARGMYTVIDMHQDAYSAYISTPPDVECPPGTSPAKGWDGAPEWATMTDGLDTCITGDRNSSPAVRAAWNHFYDDTDGIRTRFAATWGAVAKRFAGRPEVAGFDLLNEPDVSRPAVELAPLYDELLRDVVTAIRDAQADASFAHLLLVEPAIPAGEPLFGIVVPDPARIGLPLDNIVAAPHNYAEAIGPPGVTIEQMNELFVGVAEQIGVPLWLGEHGFWDTSDATLEKLGRFAADQDRLVLGGAWWQWRQPCGDPHSVPYGGYKATSGTSAQIHLHALTCPGDEDLGQTEVFARVVRRAYPRAAPGRITLLESDPDTGALRIQGRDAHEGQGLVVWVPSLEGWSVATVGFYDTKIDSYAGGALIIIGYRAGSNDSAGEWSLELVPS